MMSLNPFSIFFNSIVGFRNWLYDNGFIKTVQLPIPVISVGNITMGGTGKTPVIQWLINELVKMGYRPGVVTRNYGVKNPKTGFVFLNHEAASQFGDEAVMLKMNNPNIPIYSGLLKWKSALKIYEEEKNINVILVDDGFQHRKLKRNFDLLLLDTSVQLSDYSWPPFGRARESINSIRRASSIIFTKCEISNPSTQSFLNRKVKQFGFVEESLEEYLRPILLRAEQKQSSPQWVKGKSFDSTKPIAQGRGYAFCGLGNPESFLKGLRNQGLKIEEFKFFSDHYKYDIKSVNTLIANAKNFDYLITTEKDFVKLLEWPKEGPSLFVVSLEYQFSGDLEGFRERLSRHLWKNS